MLGETIFVKDNKHVCKNLSLAFACGLGRVLNITEKACTSGPVLNLYHSHLECVFDCRGSTAATF